MMVSLPESPAPADDLQSFGTAYARIAPALQAWAALRIRPRLRRYCEPEDLLQEIWCRAFAIRNRFDPERTTFRQWMFRVAKNVLLEVVRRSRKDDKVIAADGRTSKLFALENTPELATSITRRVARDEQLREFRQKIESLAPDERTLFAHIGLEGLSYDEAADRLGLSRDATKKRWHRLRARLEASGLPAALLA